MIEKQIIFRGRTEEGIFCQPIFGSSGVFEKTAGAPPFADLETGEKLRSYLGKIQKPDRQKHLYVLVNALGASEYFGPNINADWFPEEALTHEGDYGYKTFLNAHTFAHHANKDKTRAFGVPVLSVWNSRMKRVELVIKLDREKAEQEGHGLIAQRIDRGEYPDVSMGCFPAGTLVTMADGTRKPIEQIDVGDMVITHLGRVRRVTELHRRRYKGALYTVKAEGHRPVRPTRSHPWLVADESDVKYRDDHSNLRWRTDTVRAEKWTDTECLDDSPQYLLEPVFAPDGKYDISSHVVQPTRAEARLLGYYLAEGHLLRNKKGELSGIELTTNENDAVHAEIEDLCAEFGTKNAPNTFDRANSEVSKGISIFDRGLAEYCSRMAGSYSKEKKLSFDVMCWGPGMQRELLGAYANGDGCSPEDEGSLKLSTASVDLAHQWLVLLPRLGIIPSFSELHHKPGTGKAKTDTTEYVIHIGKQWAQGLSDVCSKVRPLEILKTKLSRNIMGPYVVTPIREFDSLEAEIDVFNFEVEEDNSYLVDGLAVHNCRVPEDWCSICWNPAKVKEDYCHHMRPPPHLRHLFGPNKILADGRIICVHNLKPRFFDISFVFIGADRTAKMMGKLSEVNGTLRLVGVDASPELRDGMSSLVDPRGRPLELWSEKRASVELDLIRGGKADRKSFSDFNPKSLARGTKVEMEHTKDPRVAREIASDHLTEDPRYYEKLEIMEETFPSEKKAGLKTSSFRKISDILKNIPSMGLDAMERSEARIPRSTLDRMGEADIGTACSTAGMMGVPLRPSEFQRLVLTRMGRGDQADSLDRENKVFRDVPKFDFSVPVSRNRFSPDLSRILMQVLRERTVFGPKFHERVARMGERTPLPTETGVADPLLDKIAAAYNGYRFKLVAEIGSAVREVRENDQLREEVSGDDLAGMFYKAAGSSLVTEESLAYLAGAFLNRTLLSGTSVAQAAGVDIGDLLM